MKKVLALIIATLIAVLFVSMISVSAEMDDIIWFETLTGDESSVDQASFDEASYDQASFDEASPDMMAVGSYTDYIDKQMVLSDNMSGTGADGENSAYKILLGAIMLISACIVIGTEKSTK